MARTAKEVGDAWGRLFGLVVTACESHHASHGAGTQMPHTESHVDTDNKHKRKARHVPGGEIGDVILTEDQRCPDSWTGTKGEVRVTYDAPAVTYLAQPAMHLLPADGPMAAQAQPASAPTDAPQGVSDIVVALPPTLPRGLYVGRLCPATGGTPDTPVLIYLDDVT